MASSREKAQMPLARLLAATATHRSLREQALRRGDRYTTDRWRRGLAREKRNLRCRSLFPCLPPEPRSLTRQYIRRAFAIGRKLTTQTAVRDTPADDPHGTTNASL